MWPAPNPCPRPRGGPACSRGSVSRATRATEIATSLFAGVCSFLACGSPSRVGSLRWRARPEAPVGAASRIPAVAAVSASTAAACARYQRAMARLGQAQTPGGPPPCFSGRRGALLSSLRRLTAAAGYAGHVPRGTAAWQGPADTWGRERGVGMGPLPIVASRLSLPERGGSFDATPFLPSRLREVFLHPSAHLRVHPPPRPRPCIMGARRELVLLLVRLYHASMCVFGRLGDVALAADGRRLWMGMFGVSKDEDRDRFICDRRPSNSEESAEALEEPLPLATQLTAITLRAGQVLRVCGEDLREFYHGFAASVDRTRRSALGHPVTLRELRDHGVDPYPDDAGDTAVAGFACTMVMGDVNAVPVAQAAHLGELRRHGGARRTMQYGTPPPRLGTSAGEDCFEAIYIDDYRSFAVLPEAESAPDVEGPDTRAAARARAAYAAEGLETHAKKRVVNARSDQFLGTQLLDGTELWPDLAKLAQIIAITVAVVLDVADMSKLEIQQLSGLWIPALMVRRPGLCLLSATFAWTAGLPLEGRHRIPPIVRDELAILAVLAPCLHADLRAPVSTELHAVDATRTRAGGAVAHVPLHVAEELYRQSQTGGELLPLERAHLRDSEQREVTAVEAVVIALTEALDFKETFAYQFSSREHISVQEEAAVTTLARREARSVTRHGRRVVTLQDSRVSVGAGTRGRSRSRRLNAKMKAAVPHLFGGGIWSGRLWTPTDINPADAPTRHRRVRAAKPPAACIRAWLEDPAARPAALDRPGVLPPAEETTHDPYSGVRVGEADNPGPPRPLDARERRRLARGDVQLDALRLEPATRALRARCLAGFRSWLASRDVDWDTTIASAQRYVPVLVEFLQFLFDEGEPFYVAENTVLAFQDECSWTRGTLGGVNVALRAWTLQEPVELRTPVPVPHFLAMLTVALSWGWYGFATVLWLMFHGLLRPAEALGVRVLDILFDDYAADRPPIVRILRPKTRHTGGPRRAHVAIDEPLLASWLRALARLVPDGSTFFPYGYGTFLHRFEDVVRGVGLPSKLYTPASCRAGGATHYWNATRDFHRLRLRGRWMAVRSLEHYIQECGAFLVETRLGPHLRDRVSSLAHLAERLVLDTLRTLKPSDLCRDLLPTRLPRVMPVGSGRRGAPRAALRARSAVDHARRGTRAFSDQPRPAEC